MFGRNAAASSYLAGAIGLVLLTHPSVTRAQDAATTPTAGDAAAERSDATAQAITVTARRRAESVQQVPDSIQAFSGATLAAAGVRDVSQLVQLTPNITFRDSFRQGQTYLTVRGITTGQQGWAPVTFVVDGVPVGSTDQINLGSLLGIERIEVLKGPQSALYGAGAIAGAINVVTRQPGDHWEGEALGGIGNRGEHKMLASIDGPVAANAGLRLDGYYHHSDGLQQDQAGRGVNGDTTYEGRGRFTTDLGALKLDLRAHLADIRAGAVYQELLPHTAAGLAAIDDFSNTPGIRRGVLGSERRRSEDVSAKIDVDLGFATLTSISAYSNLRQNLFGTTSWGTPPTTSFCGAVGGAGQAPDCVQAETDNFKTFSQDIRLSSSTNDPIQWLVGGALLSRKAVNGISVAPGVRQADGGIAMGTAYLVNRFDRNRDHFAGVYGQVIARLTPALELTAALRYDRDSFNTTQFADAALTQLVSVTQSDGSVASSQFARDGAWQPKVQLSYRWSPHVMTYATVGKGFRTGFFNTGTRTAAETTWNYEAGIKTDFWQGRGIFNLSAFHIDYSNQQYTSIISTPPYRATTNIPQTRINGIEAESSLRIAPPLTAGVALGYTDAVVKDALRSHDPFTPALTSNLWVQLDAPLGAQWRAAGRIDWRYQGPQYLGRGNLYRIGDKNYVNARASLARGNVTLTAYVQNLTNDRQADGFEDVGFGYLRYNSNPRSYGLELGYRF